MSEVEGTLTVAALVRTTELTDAPFGVNLRGDAPDLPQRAALLKKHRVRVVASAVAPAERVIRDLKDAGVVVVSSIGGRRHAEARAVLHRLGATA